MNGHVAWQHREELSEVAWACLFENISQAKIPLKQDNLKNVVNVKGKES